MSYFSVLPRLPVPPLSGSLDRYLRSLRPLLTPAQYSHTLQLREDFESGQGAYLHEKLVQLSRETDNWAGFVSVQARYLRNRSSLTLTNGVGIGLVPVPLDAEGSIIPFLSVYIVASCTYCHRVRNNNIPQRYFDNKPLCMEGYQHIFSATRIPGPKIDTYQFSPHSNHIVIMYRGNVYKVPVQEGDRLLAPQEVASLLSRVFEDREEGHNLGLLTVLDRDMCHIARAQLMLSPVNRRSLAAIEGCMSAVCIDDFEIGSLSEGEKIKTGVFGDFRNNFPTFNRWYGICHQIMFSRDGWMTSTNEHSLFDGGLKLDIGDTIASVSDTNSLPDTGLKVERLEWDISPPIVSLLKEARHFLSGICSQYNVHILHYPGYGKEFIGENTLYYQGYMQLAFQLAYYKLYHGLAPSYQPVSLRRYKGGRLEHPHIVSDESKLFVEAVDNNNYDFKEKYRLMKLAFDKHKQIVIDVNNGNVYCKHMLGLKMLAEEENMKVGLFQNESFQTFTQYNMASSGMSATSPMMSNHPMHSGVGHFVFFCPRDGHFEFSITTLLHSPQCITSQQFGASICNALDEMRLIVMQATNGMLSSKL